MIMTMIFSLKAWLCYLASSDANGMVIYLGKLGQSLFPSFQTGFVVAPENFRSQELFAMLDRQGDLTQEQMLSELIYEGEIHRLLKTYWSISKDAIFYTNVLKKILKMLSVLKPTGGLAIWFSTVISLVQLSEALRYDLFLPKTILYQDKDTCAIRLGFGHLNEEEIS
jgi:GntR family transcriptional regulator/MocR family aminotransferase